MLENTDVTSVRLQHAWFEYHEQLTRPPSGLATLSLSVKKDLCLYKFEICNKGCINAVILVSSLMN